MSDGKRPAKKEAGESTGKAEEAVKGVASTAKEAAAAASDKAAEAGGAIRDAAQRAGQAASDGYTHLSEEAREAFNKGHDAGARCAESFESRVRQRPLRTVLIAAGIGCIFGCLMASNHRRR